MSIKDILVTNCTSKLPHSFGPVSDNDIRKQAEFRPGGVAVVAVVIPAAQGTARSSYATPEANAGIQAVRRSVTFRVETIPVAQPRQRHRVIQRAGAKPFAQNYTPAKDPVQDFKRDIRCGWEAALLYADRETCMGWDGSAPMAVQIVAVFPRPASRTKKRGLNARYRKVSRPDVDNVAKAVLDALTGHAWTDDSQVWSLTVQKWVAAAGESPSVTISIWTVE